jgi:hypothetical protein
MKLKINDVELIQGVYVKHVEDFSFHRRIYKFLSVPKGGVALHIVHYLREGTGPGTAGAANIGGHHGHAHVEEHIRLLVYQHLTESKPGGSISPAPGNFPVNKTSASPSQVKKETTTKNNVAFPVVSSSAFPQQQIPLAILEFAPRFCFVDASVRDWVVLVLDQHVVKPTTVMMVRFSYQDVPVAQEAAHFVSSNVVKCVVPVLVCGE